MIRVESKELKILGKQKGSASEDICRQAWLLKRPTWWKGETNFKVSFQLPQEWCGSCVQQPPQTNKQ